MNNTQVITFIQNWNTADNTIDQFHKNPAWDKMTDEQKQFMNNFRNNQSEMEDAYRFYSDQGEVSEVNNWLNEITNYNEFYTNNVEQLFAIANN